MIAESMSELHFDRISNAKVSPSSAHDDFLAWLDTIPLSRPIRHLPTDFADGILIAEIIGSYFPDSIDYDRFRPARKMSQRTKNWRRLNSDALPKLSLTAPGTLVHHITNGDQRSVELFLLHLREKIEEYLLRTGRKSRLQWETCRSFQHERPHLPPLVPQPVSRRRAFPMSGRFVDSHPFFHDEQCRIRDEEMRTSFAAN